MPRNHQEFYGHDGRQLPGTHGPEKWASEKTRAVRLVHSQADAEATTAATSGNAEQRETAARHLGQAKQLLAERTMLNEWEAAAGRYAEPRAKNVPSSVLRQFQGHEIRNEIAIVGDEEFEAIVRRSESEYRRRLGIVNDNAETEIES